MNIERDGAEDQILDVATTEDNAESIIYLDATLTIQNVNKLHQKLKSSYSVHELIEINASQVSSIDTASLQLLVALKKEAAYQQKDIVITSPSPRFIESAELLGFLEILEIDALAMG